MMDDLDLEPRCLWSRYFGLSEPELRESMESKSGRMFEGDVRRG